MQSYFISCGPFLSKANVFLIKNKFSDSSARFLFVSQQTRLGILKRLGGKGARIAALTDMYEVCHASIVFSTLSCLSQSTLTRSSTACGSIILMAVCLDVKDQFGGARNGKTLAMSYEMINEQ